MVILDGEEGDDVKVSGGGVSVSCVTTKPNAIEGRDSR